MIMATSTQQTPAPAFASRREIAREEDIIGSAEMCEQLIKQGLTKTDLSYLVGYRSPSGLPLALRSLRIAPDVCAAIATLHRRVIVEKEPLATIRREAEALKTGVETAKRSRGGTLSRRDGLIDDAQVDVAVRYRDELVEAGLTGREVSHALGYSSTSALADAINQRRVPARTFVALEELHAQHCAPAPAESQLARSRNEHQHHVPFPAAAVRSAAAPTRESAGRDTIWASFERALAGIASSHRIMREAKERFANPLTEAGIQSFVERLMAMERDFTRVLDACR